MSHSVNLKPRPTGFFCPGTRPSRGIFLVPFRRFCRSARHRAAPGPFAKEVCGLNEALNHVRYFTAVLTWNEEKQQRHKIYIRAQKAI